MAPTNTQSEHTSIENIPTPPRPYTLSYFAVLIFLVAPIWSTTPAASLFIAHTLFIKHGGFWALGTTQRTTFCLALCEAIFSAYYYHLERKVSAAGTFGPGNVAELQTIFTRLLKTGMANLPEEGYDEETLDTERPGSPAESITLLGNDDPRAVDFRHSIRAWFRNAPWSSLRRQGVTRWLYWTIFNDYMPSSPQQISSSHQAILDHTYDQLQKRTGYVIPEGEGSAPLLLTLDKMVVCFRPLWWYTALAVINRYLEYRLEKHYQTRRISHEGLDFLIRIPTQWNAQKGPTPILFIHGLGLGLLQYYTVFIELFGSFTDRPILIPLQPHISQDIFHPRYLTPLPRREAVKRYTSLITKLGWTSDIALGMGEDDSSFSVSGRGVTVVSHSNGSYLHAWILKENPFMVSRSCFVDPVTFCGWEGELCYNFLYRPSRTGIELIMRYFVGTELGVANVLRRHFDWTSNSLFYEEIPHARDPQKALYVLGGQDDIVNSPRVKKYLTSHGIKKGIYYNPTARHGQALIGGGEGFPIILQWLRDEDSLTT
ncbi:hypothetical protein BDV98DRAFT_560740 [Pterulicium gracile]|uniref:Alpha/Beta hydrolase protein n=1 Tax=Pterulicium gracile TaxID=1884261 RepID=A0A5C3QUZ6_9AGAR|nr:hypothetical protein BDV98DRAFT_560740 [Pterula gracilis]